MNLIVIMDLVSDIYSETYSCRNSEINDIQDYFGCESVGSLTFGRYGK